MMWESFNAGQPLEVTFQRRGGRYRGSAHVIRAVLGADWAHVQGTGPAVEVN